MHNTPNGTHMYMYMYSTCSSNNLNRHLRNVHLQQLQQLRNILDENNLNGPWLRQAIHPVYMYLYTYNMHVHVLYMYMYMHIVCIHACVHALLTCSSLESIGLFNVTISIPVPVAWSADITCKDNSNRTSTAHA